MSKEISRRNFFKLMLSKGVTLATLSPLDLLASDYGSFKGKFNETYDITQLYSNGMVFSEEETENIPGTKTNLTYFVQNSDDVKGIDEVQFSYEVSDNKDKSIKFHAKFVGKIIDGNYKIDNIQTEGQLSEDPMKQYQLEHVFWENLKPILEDGVNENLVIFNKVLEDLISKYSGLKSVQKDYNPFSTKYEKMEDIIRGAQDILFK